MQDGYDYSKMGLTAIKNWDVRDLNHALVAAIMAQQIERERHNTVGKVEQNGSTNSSTTATTTISSSVTSTVASTAATLTNETVLGEIAQQRVLVEFEPLDGKIIAQIVTGSVFLLLEVLLVLAYIILIKNNKIDYRQRMTYILILICTRKLTFLGLYSLSFSLYRNDTLLYDIPRNF